MADSRRGFNQCQRFEKCADVQSSPLVDNRRDPSLIWIALLRKKKNKRRVTSFCLPFADHASRLIRTVIGDPAKMTKKLDDSYDYKSTASKIYKISELVSIRYTSLLEDLSKHIDRLAGLVEQLRGMFTVLYDSLAIGILVVSIEVSQLFPATAAINTLGDADLNCKDVSSGLIKEMNTLRGNFVSSTDRAAAASHVCVICSKQAHRTLVDFWTH